ncbi:Uncharacterised protein [Mycobacterium tuberculosis]|nr:Uncharacterised protein [Mycobacterium tuberculosis]
MARSANAVPRTANATARVNRALGDSCAATAVKTIPEAASATPNATDPAGATSVASRPNAPIAPVAIDAPNDSSSAPVRLA